jgi:hypothetical protein
LFMRPRFCRQSSPLNAKISRLEKLFLLDSLCVIRFELIEVMV